MEKRYTRAEAAEMLRVTSRTIDRWLRAGTLQGTKVGGRWLIPESAIQSVSPDIVIRNGNEE